MKGLTVYIYKNNGDCSNGGLSSKYSKATLIGKNVDGVNVASVVEPSEDAPAVKLVSKKALEGGTLYYCEPVEVKKEGYAGYMFGGCFVYSCDSRFPFRYPIKLFDRQESVKLYDMLSR